MQSAGIQVSHTDEFISGLDLAIDKLADWLGARLGDCETGGESERTEQVACVGDFGAIFASVTCFDWNKPDADIPENCDIAAATSTGSGQDEWPSAFTWTKPNVSQSTQLAPGQTVEQGTSEGESDGEQCSIQEAAQAESQSDDPGDWFDELPIRFIASDEVTVDWNCDGEIDLSLRFEQPNLLSLDWANENWSDCSFELPQPLFRIVSDWLSDFAA